MGPVAPPQLDTPDRTPTPAPPAPNDRSPRPPLRRLRNWLNHTGPEYKVGTLTYTRLGLFLVFFWVLWGDFVWTVMELVFPASMPLQLDRMGVPAEWIGYMMTTASAVINMTLVPVVSVRSDRTRTRWGRRIPYILFTMPLLCLFLALLGFSDSIGAWIRSSSLPASLGLSPVVLIIAVMGVLILLYDVANVFVNSIYWYLFRDVVPAAFLGRFMATFRMVATFGGMVWGGLIYKHVETHTREIYLGAAAMYFLGIGAMCLMVREGSYPPPDAPAKTGPPLSRLAREIRTYLRECFTHPVFILFYLSQALIAVGAACGMYKTLFYVRHLNFSTGDLGLVAAWIAPVSLAAAFPLGWLVDKVHPMRAYLVAMTGTLPLLYAGFFYADYTVLGYTINAFTLYITVNILQLPVLQTREASEVPLQMRLYPRMQHGQFSSANALLRHFATVVGSIAGATFIGYLHRTHGAAGYAYSCLWHGAFQTVAVLCLWAMFFYWRRHGADNFRYEVAPTPPPQ